MYREKHGMPAVTTQIASESPLAGPPGWRCVHLTGRFDSGDGSGLKEVNSVFCCSPLGRFGGYTTFAYTTTVPVQLAGQERATLAAIVSSFSENEQVIAGEGRAIAAPEIARIHEIGRRAEAQASAAHASEDAEAARTESHWDDGDKASKAFSEYQRDEAVVQDNESNTHSTISAQSADDLVRANPQRYEYVPTPDLVKGVDY
jgi:hypothetical protein